MALVFRLDMIRCQYNMTIEADTQTDEHSAVIFFYAFKQVLANMISI